MPSNGRRRGRRRLGGGENRRRQIERGGDLARHRPCGHLAGPAQEGRHADATLPQRGLVMKQRRVPREPLAAVVVREDHQRVFGELQPVQRRQNPADARVHALQHAGVISACAVEPGRVDAHVVRPSRHLEGPVDGVVGDVEEERLGCALLDESHRSVREQVRQVTGSFDRAIVLPQVDDAGSVLCEYMSTLPLRIPKNS